MIQALREIGVWVGTGPLAPLAMVLAFATVIDGLAILILALSGRTVSGAKIVRHKVNWNWKALAVVALIAIAILHPLARLVHLYWPEREGAALAPA